MKQHFRQSIPAALLLNLLVPGLGHIVWREYLFGLFIFLIMLIAAALFFVSFLINLPGIAYWILMLLPAIFYIFTFVDLSRTVQRKRTAISVSPSRFWIILCLGFAYQLAAPSALGNFAIRNHPAVFRIPDYNLKPGFQKGEIVKASRLAYSVDLFFLNQPLYYRLPERFTVVRYPDHSGGYKLGVVIGLPNEEVQVVEGVVIVDGYPQVVPAADDILLTGDLPLTAVGRYSILVATIRMNRIEKATEIPLTRPVGKVEPLL